MTQATAIITKISPVSFDTDQEKFAKNWSKVPGFSNWLLNHHDMRAWFNSTNNFLWLRGDPGAGKSTFRGLWAFMLTL